MKRALFSTLAFSIAALAGTWPGPVPARVKDGANPDLFVMTLGQVATPLAQGVFDPGKDEVRLADGTVLPHYYRDTLKQTWFKPLDKSIFPLPPSGWCTWYYYYQDLNEREVRLNTDWLARNLKDFGATVVQVDDAWQKELENGSHGSRDWTGVDAHFPSGMASLASYIKDRGFVPGLWIAPHGQSREAVVKANPGVFLLRPDGTTASDTWEGKWLLDPSAPAGRTYLRELFDRLVGWGFDYFKIDGQPVVVDAYRKTQAFMQHPGDAETLYRGTLDPIRQALGPRRYLLGCWGIPVEGMGLMNGTRTGGDIVAGWSGFFTALEPTMQYYYQHNIAWYTDPDVLLLRAPLTLDQARAWATLVGLTGQALFAGDRLTDLAPARVELLKRVFPATDIRPLDLFPSPRNKRVWDLKIAHLGRAYDVVGAFNFREDRSSQILLDWKDLGLKASGPVHVFDYWNHEYLGAWEAGMAVDLAPTSCRVLTLLPDDGRIHLVSTSRHITQGWVDLLELTEGASTLKGRSHVIKGDPYELAFAYPRGRNFRIVSAQARSGATSLPVVITDHQGWGTARLEAKATGEVAWKVTFEAAPTYTYPVRPPDGLQADPEGLDGASLRWRDAYYLNSGYQVYLDGKLLGRTGSPRFPLKGLDPWTEHRAEVRCAWEDGATGTKGATLAFRLGDLLPERLPLADLEPAGYQGRTASSGAFTVDRRRRQGIQAHAESEVAYDLRGLYGSFTFQPAFDDSDRGRTKVTFTVLGDGKKLWTSGPVDRKGLPGAVRVPVTGVQRLVLRSAAPGAAPEDDAWADAPHAAWLEPELSGRVAAP